MNSCIINAVQPVSRLNYNRQRRHLRLGNLSPATFAQPWARQQLTA